MSRSRIALVVTALLYASFLFWYGGSGDPLTPEETEALLAEIAAASPDGEAHDGDLLESILGILRDLGGSQGLFPSLF